MRNTVHLVTYVDRLGGSGIAELADLLGTQLNGLFGGVHLLPFFYPIDGADAGFDPIDHTQVDRRLGQWGDIRSLADEHEVMADLIVNHISSSAPQFQDFLRNGRRSTYEGLFLTAEAVFPGVLRHSKSTRSIAHVPAPPLRRTHWMTESRRYCGRPSLRSRLTSTYAIPRAQRT